MTKNRPNSAYIIIWKKTYDLLKKLAEQLQEPMTNVVQRAVEMLDKDMNK